MLYCLTCVVSLPKGSVLSASYFLEDRCLLSVHDNRAFLEQSYINETNQLISIKFYTEYLH
jgi:hypothetical protein